MEAVLIKVCRITLQDNRRNKGEQEEVFQQQLESLRKIEDESLNGSSNNIIKYPETAEFKTSDEDFFIKLKTQKIKDGGGENYIEPETNNNEKKVKVHIYTSNIVGVLKCDDAAVEVYSRFDKSSRQYFFSTMLSHTFECGFLKDFKPNIDSHGIWEIMLVLVFADALEKAYRQGLLKQYIETKYNNFSFKGRLDVPRHLKLNVPFQGRIAWSNREYSYDNPILWLINHCINNVSNKHWKLWSSISTDKPAVLEAEKAVRRAAPTYSRIIPHHLLKECSKPIRHPLFTEYEPLRKICLMILREEGIGVYNADEGEVYGILFDCAWLWENFVYKHLLSRMALQTPDSTNLRFIKPTKKCNIFELSKCSTENNNISEEKDNSEGENDKKPSIPRYKPDFITEPTGNGIVLDAKYKEGYEEKNNPWDNKDIFQVTSYLFLNDCRLAGLVFPTQGLRKIRQYRYKGKPDRFFWYIPFWVGDTSRDSFYEEFELECDQWTARLTEEFKKLLKETDQGKETDAARDSKTSPPVLRL